MDLFEIYLLLFTDVLTSNLAFNVSSELVLNTMQIFSSYNSYLMVTVATIAYIVSIFINYIFGIACYKILAPTDKKISELNSKIITIRNSRFLSLIISFGFIPFFGKFIVLLLGFCRINFLQVLLITTLTKFIYYTVVVFYT